MKTKTKTVLAIVACFISLSAHAATVTRITGPTANPSAANFCNVSLCNAFMCFNPVYIGYSSTYQDNTTGIKTIVIQSNYGTYTAYFYNVDAMPVGQFTNMQVGNGHFVSLMRHGPDQFSYIDY